VDTDSWSTWRHCTAIGIRRLECVWICSFRYTGRKRYGLAIGVRLFPEPERAASGLARWHRMSALCWFCAIALGKVRDFYFAASVSIDRVGKFRSAYYVG